MKSFGLAKQSLIHHKRRSLSLIFEFSSLRWLNRHKRRVLCFI